MCLACFCACAIRPVGRSVDDIHTNRVGIDLANTWLAALAPINQPVEVQHRVVVYSIWLPYLHTVDLWVLALRDVVDAEHHLPSPAQVVGYLHHGGHRESVTTHHKEEDSALEVAGGEGGRGEGGR